MGDGQHSGCHKEWQTKEGADDDQAGHNEQVQVVALTFLCKKKQSKGSAKFLHNLILIVHR